MDIAPPSKILVLEEAEGFPKPRNSRSWALHLPKVLSDFSDERYWQKLNRKPSSKATDVPVFSEGFQFSEQPGRQIATGHKREMGGWKWSMRRDQYAMLAYSPRTSKKGNLRK